MAETFWKFSTAFCKNDKVCELSAALSIPTFAAGALVALLYAWGAEKADDTGSINDFTERAIESACLWSGTSGALTAAFCKVGILNGDLANRSEDDPLVIATWETVASDLIKKRIDGRNRKRKQRDKERDGAQDVTQDVTCDGTCDVTPSKKIECRMQNTEAENIFAVSAADDHPNFNTIEAYASSNLQTLSPGNMQELGSFKADLPEELIRYAVDESCAAGKRSWAYVRKILYRYVEYGIKTVGEAKQRGRKPQQSAVAYERDPVDLDNLYPE